MPVLLIIAAMLGLVGIYLLFIAVKIAFGAICLVIAAICLFVALNFFKKDETSSEVPSSRVVTSDETDDVNNSKFKARKPFD